MGEGVGYERGYGDELADGVMDMSMMMAMMVRAGCMMKRG